MPERFFQCPNRVIDQEAREGLMVVRMAVAGRWPHQGGFNDQPAKLTGAMSVVGQTDAEMDSYIKKIEGSNAR
jgi:hypothetical protein